MIDSMFEDEEEEEESTEESRDTDQQQGMSNDMDSNISIVQNDSDKIDSLLIKKILDEMKSEFTRGTPNKVDDSSDSGNEKDDTEENQENLKPQQENFQRIKVSDIISLKKFEIINDDVSKNVKEAGDNLISNGNIEVGKEQNIESLNVSTLENETGKKNDSENTNDDNNVSNTENDDLTEKTNIVIETLVPEVCEKESEDSSINYSKNSVISKSNNSTLTLVTPKKTSNEKKTSLVEDCIISEPRPKRSLRNQVLTNKDIEEDGGSRLKRSSRRFSKDHKRESVLQSAIARKEKSFSSLSSNEERSYRRGQRSPRQNNLSSNNGCSSSNNSSSNSITNEVKNINKSINSKINKSPRNLTASPPLSTGTPESNSKIIKSPQYDEKLQSTIDNLKFTLEKSNINTQKISKLDFSEDSLLKTEKVVKKGLNEMSAGVVDKKENQSLLNIDEVVQSVDDDSKSITAKKDATNDNIPVKRFRGRPPKRKTRYYKGLKYTFKGGLVKNSNRTWSMTRRKKYNCDKLSALEKVIKQDSLVKEELEEKDELEENSKYLNKSPDVVKERENANDVHSKIEDVCDPKMLSSIFGVDISEVKISGLKKSETVSNSVHTSNNETVQCNESTTKRKGVKRKLIVDESDEIGEEHEKKKQATCESPTVGDDTPIAQENPEVAVITLTQSDNLKDCEPTKGMCFCNSKEQYYVSPLSCKNELYCQAIDSLDGRLIGCCNTVTISSARLVRASVKLPYLVLCNVHHQRIQRHNCCPGCGNFCTQGRFMQCQYGHHYHKDCHLSSQPFPSTTADSSLKENNKGELNNKDEAKDEKEGEDDSKPTTTVSVCLHCGTDSFYEVNISLGAHKYPVFLPLQKPPKQVPSAKMTFGGCSVELHDVKVDHCIEDEKYLVDDDENKPLVSKTCLVLPSGLKISSEGLPDAGLKDKLDKLLHVACTVTTPPSGRYTLRNMYQAAKCGDTEKLIYMLASGLNPNHQFREWVMGTALHAACYSGHMTVVHLLIQAGSDIDILDKEQNTPLMIAVLNRHNDIVKYLVKAGADVTFKGGDGMTALHLASKTGNLEACHYLLSNFNVPRFFIDTVDDGRWTPLVWAAEHCHYDVVRFLLSKRADPLVRDAEQNIALHWAALAGSVEISEALLNYGSEINSTNAHGDTALHIAARQNAYSCTVLLLSRGSRVDLRNRAGFSALECCLVADSPTYKAIKLNVELKNLSNSRRISRILTNDITRGHEMNPVQCINAFDDEGPPQDFTYINENCFTSNISVDRTITSLQFCKCRDSCTTGCCMCGKISIRCWYDNDGRLLPEFNFSDPPMLFECNRACMCNKVTCKNRVIQHGIKARFQLFKTSTNKGWGVRTLRLIAKGSFVCEYIGEIISDCEADTREDDSYLFDLDNRDGETYCIDARKYGNIARFINHMCVPNLLPVRVFVDHQDLHFPRIAFFANRDIQAHEELGFDYGEKFWIIKCKSFTCTCGAEKCRYSDTSIQQTLENYKRKLQQEDSNSSQ